MADEAVAKQALNTAFTAAKELWSTLGQSYQDRLAELEVDANAIVADLLNGKVTLEEAKEAGKSATLAVRSLLVRVGLDAEDQAPSIGLSVVEKLLPILLKAVLA